MRKGYVDPTFISACVLGVILCVLGGNSHGITNETEGTLKIPIKGEYYDVNQITDAIYWAEGGEKASKPYGILSVPCSSEGDCRNICKNTVRNNYERWIKQGQTQDYIEFLANRYAPIGSSNDPSGLNQHWIKNVLWFLRNPKQVIHRN
jgi:hypothetical protein